MASGNNTEQPDAPLRELQVRILLGSPTSRFRVLSPAATPARTAPIDRVDPAQAMRARSTTMWWKPNSPTTWSKKAPQRTEVVRRHLGKGDKNNIPAI